MLFNKEKFISFVVDEQLLRFGDFVTKSGRKTPYFFNVGNIQSGKKLKQFASFYATFIVDNHLVCPTLFGPAYKGISLSIATSIALSELGYDCNFCYNRKEAKTHGEGGNLIGAKLEGNILVLDDVITSGLSIHESMNIIQQYNAKAQSIVVALDRKENAIDEQMPATTSIEKKYGIHVHSLLSVEDIVKK